MKPVQLGAIFVAILALTTPTHGAQPGPAFSSLPAEQQQALRDRVAPPPLKQRYGPYSTPMYYLFEKGGGYNGAIDIDPNNRVYPELKGKPGFDYGSWTLERNRPDWQQTLLHDWAELGMNNTHILITPQADFSISETHRQALLDYIRISEQLGLKIGVRLDALGGYEAWEMHPDNPDNVTDRYLPWVRQIASLFAGKAAYYVLGDELTLHETSPKLGRKLWTAEKYLEYFKRVAGAVKEADPQAKVSMFAASSGQWFNVLYLLKIGYAQHGDAVAINYYNYQDIPKFFDDARKLAPGLMFLSNGVGYLSNGLAKPRYPEWDPYYKYPTEQAHADAVAKNMFAWWDLGADTAPYYVAVRNWVVRGKVYPFWYGFFGFQDLVVDDDDHLTIRRYPGWYAYQTIAHTFYNRGDFVTPSFAVESSVRLTMLRAYQHDDELLLMVWSDDGDKEARVIIGSGDYRFATRVAIQDHRDWSDVAYELSENSTALNLMVTNSPQIIRLFKWKP